MYGGMDRDAVPVLREADRNLIAGTTKEYGSRKKASAAFANRGFLYYERDDLVNAMRRFNQAWLLDKQNGDAYWGFAGVLAGRKQYCKASELARTGLSKPNIQSSAFADAAYIYIGCARLFGPGDASKRDALVDESERALSEAMKRGAPPDYVLDRWARSRAGIANYSGAWEKIKEYRRVVGKEPSQRFVDRLSSKMAEPK
jgi:tetratricopeptide (TPR) repeat protein